MISRRTKIVCLNLVTSFAVILVGAYWMDVYLNKERTRQVKPRKAPVRVVDIEVLERTLQSPTLHATGIVKAKHQVTLRPEVKGVVENIAPHLFAGTTVRKGDLLLKLSSELYQWQVEEAQAQLTKHQATYQIELGKQRSAKMEHQLSGMTLNAQSLAILLREPQLQQIEADIAKAKVVLERAKWHVQQTALHAPFDGMITERHVDMGSYVKENANTLALISTDEFWVEARVPVDTLRWLTIPHHAGTATKACLGSRATVVSASGAEREGCVVGMLPQLDNKLKTATVLVSVRDPLALAPSHAGQAPLLVNDHVEVALLGNQTEAFKIARRHLNNNTFVWVMDEHDQLARRDVAITFRDKAHVLISEGLSSGERMVTTPLQGSVEGIALKQRGAPKQKVAQEGKSSRAARLPSSSSTGVQGVDHAS